MFSKLFKKDKKIISDEQQELFQKQQSEIYPDIARELISSTPEHWNSAILVLEESNDSVAHSIISDENHKDVVTPSMELFETTRRLELLFKKYNTMFKKASFRVWLNEEENWQFNVDYEYHT